MAASFHPGLAGHLQPVRPVEHLHAQTHCRVPVLVGRAQGAADIIHARSWQIVDLAEEDAMESEFDTPTERLAMLTGGQGGR